MGDKRMEEINSLRQNMAALTRRAAVDESFRRLCLADATAAYQALAGQPWPTPYAVRFTEPDQDIPPKQEAEPAREITPEQQTGAEGVRWMRLPRYLPKTWLG